VPNWTNAPGARQGFIALAAGLWLAGRLAIWYAGALPPVLVMVIDMAFLPVLALKILSQLLKRPKPQNMMFMGFLALLWASNGLVHLEWGGVIDNGVAPGLRAGLLATCSLIAVLGGRVTPAFTRNAMKRAGEPESAWPQSNKVVERGSLIFAFLTPLAVLAGAPDMAAGALALIFGALQIIRLSRWRWRWCLTQPILLALHAGLAMLALGLILWGLAMLGFGTEIAGLHILGIGCVGGMTIAVMSRAGLGHSGRPLLAPKPVALAYGAIALAALLRWIGPELSDVFYMPAILGTGALWVLGFALYLVAMWPALTQPRLS